jgi:hypothetical protein
MLPQCKEAQSRQWRMSSPASLRPFISFCDCCVDIKSSTIRFNVKFWEIIADKLSKAGWSLGWVSALILKGERSGLLMRTAMTVNALLCTRMTSSLPSWNWKGRFVSAY